MGFGTPDHLLGTWGRRSHRLLLYPGLPSFRGRTAQALSYAFLEETNPYHSTSHDILCIRLYFCTSPMKEVTIEYG